jgi:hypothetical protein
MNLLHRGRKAGQVKTGAPEEAFVDPPAATA